MKKQSTDPVFDEVSVRLSDETYRNMNQKCCLIFLNNINFWWAFDVKIVRCLFFLEYP